MELKQAYNIGETARAALSPHCERFEVAGSVRRRRPFCHDIDIVCIPSNQGAFLVALQSLGKLKLGGGKIMRVQMTGAELDVYIATPETWATLLLIRTGSAAHNVKLCIRANGMGMKLHADGSGLFRLGQELSIETRIAGDTEGSIFEALGMAWIAPEDREV